LGGGGLYVYGATAVNGGRFEDNSNSIGNGGGMLVNGALNLTATQFISNAAANLGGALYHRGAAAGDNARIVNALFARNHAASGGAALLLASSNRAVVLHSTISDLT